MELPLAHVDRATLSFTMFFLERFDVSLQFVEMVDAVIRYPNGPNLALGLCFEESTPATEPCNFPTVRRVD